MFGTGESVWVGLAHTGFDDWVQAGSGLDPDAGGEYSLLPYRLALASSTADGC
ncbi:hypothetical protein [Streptomyces sp. B6B3]|uniref:hypothetical protein n=1 Tax=Streptomyces sp. B6B3 TaxID=3153570 RepID=UPI00325D466F